MIPSLKLQTNLPFPKTFITTSCHYFTSRKEGTLKVTSSPFKMFSIIVFIMVVGCYVRILLSITLVQQVELIQHRHSVKLFKVYLVYLVFFGLFSSENDFSFICSCCKRAASYNCKLKLTSLGLICQQ